MEDIKNVKVYDDSIRDSIRASLINDRTGGSKFIWVKEFVFSENLNKQVALAGNKTELFLIDISGEIIENLDTN